MRVVAGAFRGRRLAVPPGARPTADRVREAVFSILGSVSGLRVLDLYAGSGALGIEALSRGAASATLVDSDRRAVEAIARNLEALGAAAEIRREDALRFLARPGEAVDLVFVDPPYHCAGRLAAPLAERLSPRLAPGARIVTESDKRHPLELRLPLLVERVYGDTLIAVHGG